MHWTITKPDGQTQKTFVSNSAKPTDKWIPTNFGTFRKDSDGIHRWILDCDFILTKPKP